MYSLWRVNRYQPGEELVAISKDRNLIARIRYALVMRCDEDTLHYFMGGHYPTDWPVPVAM